MPAKEQAHSADKKTATRRSAQPTIQEFDMLAQQSHPATIVQRARLSPGSLTPRDVLQLQQIVGNWAVGRFWVETMRHQVTNPVSPISAHEQIAEQSTLTELPKGLVGPTRNVPVPTQASHLNSTRLQTAQRQAVAGCTIDLSPVALQSPIRITESATGDVIQAGYRYANPRRRESASTTKEQIQLSEHHLIPHALLTELYEVAEHVKATTEMEQAYRELMPPWENLTVGEITKAPGGWKADLLNQLEVKPSETDSAEAIYSQLMEKCENLQLQGRLERIKQTWIQTKKGTAEEPEYEFAYPYFEWIPGNLVVGPKARRHDPGDRLDVECLGLIPEERQNLVIEIFKQVQSAAQDEDREAFLGAIQGLLLMKDCPLTEFNPTKWACDDKGNWYVNAGHT